MSSAPFDRDLHRAANVIRNADALLIAAGAGMGVDSGLPAVRGAGGFAEAYPEYARRGITYESLMRPAALEDDERLAWGYYARCIRAYRAARPPAGFAILRRWASRCPGRAFVYTSNVDEQFQAAGFDPQHVMECHGSALRLQCARLCGEHLWPADQAAALEADPATGRAAGGLPVCPKCGAGTDVPAVRLASEWAMLQRGATLIRINPADAEVPARHIGIAAGARAA